jgi:hypothetical protein
MSVVETADEIRPIDVVSSTSNTVIKFRPDATAGADRSEQGFSSIDTLDGQHINSSIGTAAIDIKAVNISALFSDPSKPLVIDLGCGFGISLLGLASISDCSRENSDNSTSGSDLSDTEAEEITTETIAGGQEDRFATSFSSSSASISDTHEYNCLGCDLSHR